MDLDLKRKVAIVTGAARGIGQAIALTFAQEGSSVVISDIDLGGANVVAEEAKKLGGQAIAVRADVTKFDEMRRMVSETLGKFGRLDILVNNAGILYTEGKPISRKSFKDFTEEEDLSGELNVTLYGVLNCTRAVLPSMVNQKGGGIINIVSDAARKAGASGATLYSAGKGGIIAFSRNLAFELGPFGIRVNCVSPGYIRTTRVEAIESGDEKSPETVKYSQAIEPLLKQNPLGRIGTPQDIANIVVFLASSASSHITGQTISVNGGSFMP